MKKMQLYILPVEHRVVFPYETFRIRILETYQNNANKFNGIMGIVPITDPALAKERGIEMVDNLPKYGTILKLTGEDKNYSLLLEKFSKNNKELKYQSAFAFGRFQILNFEKTTPYYLANVNLLSDDISIDVDKLVKLDNSLAQLRMLAKTYVDIVYKTDPTPEKKQLIESEQSLNKLIFSIASYIAAHPEEKQVIFQINDVQERINAISKMLQERNTDLKITSDLVTKVSSEIDKENKKIIPRQQPPSQDIAEANSGPEDELGQLEQQIKAKNLPEIIFKAVMKEFKRLKSIKSQNAESNVIRTYIDTILELPWTETSTDTSDLKAAEDILNRDHSSLDKVKKRILEFLAVRFLKGNSKGSIICLCGPPGVGKTSLGKSIADSLGRKFERISLGGVRDEAEVRGHRRTYVGALPGVIIQALKKCQTKNPVILLDEIDKINRDYKGDPSSALLEVLDPNQNFSFTDHYLSLPFDLSDVMFIATANQLETIQGPLLDRMEVINIPGYTYDEKHEIAVKYLIPKQISENGINTQLIEIEKPALDLVIKAYTREAGVRQLERNISSLCRSVAVKYSKHKQMKIIKDTTDNMNTNAASIFPKIIIDQEYVRDVLGVEIYDEDEIKDRISSSGIAIGMAWTAVGGKLLIIESSMCPGKGNIQLTGQLGDVMKESIHTVLGWIKSNTASLAYLFKDKQLIQSNKLFLDDIDIHVHFPAAATPKDGPSAGITIATALLSLLSGRKVRSDIAMTGEISLKGQVLPVGGIKEKCLAAYSYGITTIILPFKNRKDTDDIAPLIKEKIKFIFVKHITEVLEVAFEDLEQLHLLKAEQDAREGNKQSKL